MAWVDIDYARSVVKQMYPGDKWRSRVRGMSDIQVLAIYYKCEEKRKNKVIHAAMVDAVKEPERNLFTPDYAEQLSLGGIF